MTRADPAALDFIERAWSIPLDLRIRKPTDDFENSRGIVYAVKPYEWYREFPPTNLTNEGQRKETFSRWADRLAIHRGHGVETAGDNRGLVGNIRNGSPENSLHTGLLGRG